jgi:hypothetical protein
MFLSNVSLLLVDYNALYSNGFDQRVSGNSSLNTVQHATTEETVFSVDIPIDWLDSDHVICVYCRSLSIPRLYNESHEL